MAKLYMAKVAPFDLNSSTILTLVINDTPLGQSEDNYRKKHLFIIVYSHCTGMGPRPVQGPKWKVDL